MTSRERNLSILLVTALVVVGGLVGIKLFKESALEVEAEIKKTEAELKRNDSDLRIAESREALVDFLDKYEPKKARYGSDVQSELKDVCERMRGRNGLQLIKNPKLVDPDPGKHYSRWRILLELRGEERSLLSFLTQVTDPKKFRSVTRLQMRPTQGDETNTKVDATIEIDQWFIADTDVTDDLVPDAEAAPVPAPPTPDSSKQQLPPGLNAGS